ncbi:MAG TPA: hypothetical protein DCZ56_08115 [Sutterella sp.]|nr:hypothetical protein [Sutterella sp.]
MLSRRKAIAAALASAAALSGVAHAAGERPKQSGKNVGTDRDLRHYDRLLTDKEALTVIRNVPHAVLSTADKNGIPYGVPVTPVYDDGKIYFHGSADANGRKTVNMLQNKYVSLCYTAKDNIVQEEFAVNFVSVVVSGTARQITDPKAKAALMYKIVHHHAPVKTDKQIEEYLRPEINLISLWEVTPLKITGKSRNKKYYFDKLKD